MRRVYYAYSLRVLTHPRTLHVLGAVVLLYVFSLFVSVGDVLYNLSLVRVYNVDSFIISAFKHTEVWTLLTLIAFAALGLSFMRSTRHLKMPHMHHFGAV